MEITLEIKDSGFKGLGVYAMRAIAKGGYITPMTGVIVEESKLNEDMFALQIGKKLWLCSPGDATDDYINHSCEPNAGFVTGEAVLYALRDIAAGEEITYDYATSIADPDWRLECACESRECRGMILPWFAMPESFRAARLAHALRYIREEENNNL